MPVKSVLLAFIVAGCVLASSAPSRAAGEADHDKQALLQLEQEWLNAYRGMHAGALERILAPGFVHILSDGRIVSRADELAYFRAQPPATLTQHPRQHFEDVEVRVYGDIAVVNGRTVTTGAAGKVIRRTSFTDVFRRSGEGWRAINAQETPCRAISPR